MKNMKQLSYAELFPGNEYIKAGANTFFDFSEPYVDDDGFFCVDMDVTDDHLNMNGIVMGGVTYSLCDHAAGIYARYIGRIGGGMDGSIKYFRPAVPGDHLTAKVHERKIGKRIGVVNVELLNASGKLLADSSFTIMFND